MYHPPRPLVPCEQCETPTHHRIAEELHDTTIVLACEECGTRSRWHVGSPGLFGDRYIEAWRLKWPVSRIRSVAASLQRAPEIARSLAREDAERERGDYHRTYIVALETSLKDASETLLCTAAEIEQQMKAPADAPAGQLGTEQE